MAPAKADGKAWRRRMQREARPTEERRDSMYIAATFLAPFPVFVCVCGRHVCKWFDASHVWRQMFQGIMQCRWLNSAKNTFCRGLSPSSMPAPTRCAFGDRMQLLWSSFMLCLWLYYVCVCHMLVCVKRRSQGALPGKNFVWEWRVVLTRCVCGVGVEEECSKSLPAPSCCPIVFLMCIWMYVCVYIL